MPVYNLIKNGSVVNTIIADEVDSIRDQYDSIEEYVAPQPQVIPSINIDNVRNNLTLAEKVKWDNGSTPNIVTAKIEFNTQRSIQEATDILNFLVSEGDISQSSMDAILISGGIQISNV